MQRKIDNYNPNEQKFVGKAYAYKHPSTIWEQIKNEIVVLIINGTLQSGEKVMSIAETAKTFNCGKSTAQKVLDSLTQDNILYKEHGVGYFVVNDPDIQTKLEKAYMVEMKNTLDKYLEMARKIKLDDKEIIERIKLSL